MKTKSTSLITKKLQKLNTIFHTLDQQSTSAITDVYTARESQFSPPDPSLLHLEKVAIVSAVILAS